MTLIHSFKIAAGLLLTLFIWHYFFLADQVENLKVDNAELQSFIVLKQQETTTLSLQIDGLIEDKVNAQIELDNTLQFERERKEQLRQRVSALEKELENERCFDLPIKYPSDWVSGYPSRDALSVQRDR
ncbi:hypothetical protein [Vibrio scophthalmi]|uniref:Uncharacterized protein n=1 Tax=Vibrio scophthalmi TaxID=45658 RepID=A0A1E3WEU7_9VIBR|nr:hypothetical protein [Vibrio scophthalmi]ODS04306.1 hypothetical protein VSF3289_03437 [Vibrio scophthalmi]